MGSGIQAVQTVNIVIVLALLREVVDLLKESVVLRGVENVSVVGEVLVVAYNPLELVVSTEPVHWMQVSVVTLQLLKEKRSYETVALDIQLPYIVCAAPLIELVHNQLRSA